ncbi:baculoviral IAP repeat-containing protein 2-like [Haliotis rubra]|uniref:baculoviral IAP repeat-containing protein 2-like n=1 Tax=Haliotis rubra TaxID=36100 RepID=UPI001EE566CE|nr:baculoviral IAP repeat-containing protein 2-like [Haliotis rubra]
MKRASVVVSNTVVTLSDRWTPSDGDGTGCRDRDFLRRLRTYSAWTGRKTPDTLQLARAGFIYTGIGDKVECERCGLKLLNWTDTDDALHEHANRRTHCPFIVSLYRKLGRTPPPKHPKYQSLQARLDSFVDWPRRYVPKTPQELASAGFFYIGSADRVTCFQCGITLRDWEEEHDPVAEHQRYSEHCQFINKTDLNQLGVAARTVECEPSNDAGQQNPDPVANQDTHIAIDHIHDTPSTGVTSQGRAFETACLICQTTKDDLTSAVLLVVSTPSTQADGKDTSSGDNVPFSELGTGKKTTLSPLQMPTSSDTKPATTSSTSRTDPSITRSSRRLAENKLLKMRRVCRVCQNEAVVLVLLNILPSLYPFIYYFLSLPVHHLGIGDKVERELCGLKLLNWTDTDDALHEHATRRTHCPFIVSLYRKLGQTPPQKHPKYQALQARLDSFVDWPRRYVPKTPEELASAGFFYIGSADRVTCFQCGITLRDWEEEHDPVAEHQRYSEHCQFINKTDLNQLGVAARTVEGEPSNDAGQQNPDPGANQDTHIAIDHIHDTPSTGVTSQGRAFETACLICQTTKDDLTSAVLLVVSTPSTQADGKDTSSGDNVPISELGTGKKTTLSPLPMPTSSDTKPATTSSTSRTDPSIRRSSRRLAEENKLLKMRRVCRVCQNEAVGELFLLCGHLVTCSVCAPKVNECVMCKKTILGTVKVFMT